LNIHGKFIALSVSSLLFIAFLGYVFPTGAKAQVTCPCGFNTIPKTPECWVDPYPTHPSPNYVTSGDACSVGNTNFDLPDLHAIGIVLEGSGCQVSLSLNLPPACGASTGAGSMTPDEVIACQCELQAYVTALNDVDGITVSGGPPYACGDVVCPEPTAPPLPQTAIPTLNGWGLVAMVGVLGIVGFMVIRRRKVQRMRYNKDDIIVYDKDFITFKLHKSKDFKELKSDTATSGAMRIEDAYKHGLMNDTEYFVILGGTYKKGKVIDPNQWREDKTMQIVVNYIIPTVFAVLVAGLIYDAFADDYNTGYYLNSKGKMVLLYDAGDGNKLTQDGEFLINTGQHTYQGDQYLNDGGYEYYKEPLEDE